MPSATVAKLLVCRGSTQTIVVQGLLDIDSNEFWTTGASVSGTLLDEFGNQVFQIPLTFIAGSNGNFSGDFGNLGFYPQLGRGYTLVITGVNNNKGITIPLLVEVVQTPSNLGAGLLIGATGGEGGGGGGGGVTSSLTYHFVTQAGVNAQLVVSGSRVLTGYAAYNAAGYAVYIKLYNENTTPDVGVDPVQMTIGVQAGQPAANSPNTSVAFSAGIGVAVVKGVADNDTTPVASGDCVIDLFYQ